MHKCFSKIYKKCLTMTKQFLNFDWVNLFLSILTDGKEYLLVYLYMIVLILTLEIKNVF